MKWLADENFDNNIVRGILRQSPGFDVVRAQDLPQVSGKEDSVLLAWAARNSRVVLTHDLSTMVPAMRRLLHETDGCAPIVLVPDSLPAGLVIEEIILLDKCSIEDDWVSGVLYLPLR